ncbi:hypothetical protein M3Y95_01080500 [Aphelenchoides besseyi]|nr:hypothetical protein M3Y95_01080500 [Aphelenchoides besseyi]
MKQQQHSSNSIITVSDEIDDYSAPQAARQPFPVGSTRIIRRIPFEQFQKPIISPPWNQRSYRSFDTPAVPQITPDLRVMQGNLMPENGIIMYEGGEEDHVEIDPDGQIDVCALEDDEVAAEESASNKRPRLEPGSSGLVKKERFVNEDEQPEVERPNRSDRCRILRRPNTNGETLASRARRENKNWQRDEIMAEFGEVLGENPNELIQEEVEIVDQDEHMARYIYGQGIPMAARRVTYANPRSLVNLNDLYSEMIRYYPKMPAHEFNEMFTTESTMSYPVNVREIISQVKGATPEQLTKLVASLAMQINYIKRDMHKIREELVDTRSVTFMRQNHGITNRNLDLTAQVTQQWVIDADPPLREVDLVQTARDVSLRIGRKNMKTRDVITRFVRSVFEAMIPEALVREYTVRDRPGTRGKSKDIGVKAKNQITGIILDLMSLYDSDVLDRASRHDRANFSDSINQTMKTVIYDMRRISPKSRKSAANRSNVVQDELEDIEEESDN